MVLSTADSVVTTLVDTRSGALASLGYSVIGAANATIGIQIGEFGESIARGLDTLDVSSRDRAA